MGSASTRGRAAPAAPRAAQRPRAPSLQKPRARRRTTQARAPQGPRLQARADTRGAHQVRVLRHAPRLPAAARAYLTGLHPRSPAPTGPPAAATPPQTLPQTRQVLRPHVCGGERLFAGGLLGQPQAVLVHPREHGEGGGVGRGWLGGRWDSGGEAAARGALPPAHPSGGERTQHPQKPARCGCAAHGPTWPARRAIVSRRGRSSSLPPPHSRPNSSRER
jgi:hypothetical protein